MKSDTHPDYKTITFTCSCGATFTAGSTMQDDFKTEICSKCHPFYTGKQKLVDSSGRVDKFMAKMKKAQKHAEKDVETIDNDEAEEAAEESAEIKEEVEANEEIAKQGEEAAKESAENKPEKTKKEAKDSKKPQE